MNAKQSDKVWALAIGLAVLQCCLALVNISYNGLEEIVSFVDPLILIAITGGLVKFKTRMWVIGWVALFIISRIAVVVTQETLSGMLGMAILVLLTGTPILIYFLIWTKSIWKDKTLEA